jgi:hypothetical protein
MNEIEDGDLFETDDDQDVTETEEDVIKSIRKTHGRGRSDRLESEQKSKKDRLRRKARREKERRFPDRGV